MKITYFFCALLLIGGVWHQTQAQPTHECAGHFIEHFLDHTTQPVQLPIQTFESNGAGLALNDLDRDGWIDIVLANLSGGETILWNKGNLVFEKQILPSGTGTRGVTTVDVDGDGWLDIVLTKQFSAPSWWRNTHQRNFELTPLKGVTNYAYVLNWADMDQDGDLDLVTGSYNAELEKVLRDTFLFSNKGGIFYYENRDGEFVPTRLSESSQALAILLIDLTGDFQPEILVGNDFGLPDMFWTSQNSVWTPFRPFAVTTHSTMSYDAGDINNDGRMEIFATDMMPYADEADYVWQPIFEAIRPAEAQVMENVLQIHAGAYVNRAAEMGLQASGWSWSGKLGDLDSDGFLDMYIVNGMIAEDLFGHLPDGELVEKNQVFRNWAGQRFVLVPTWNLESTASGRSMSMADLDQDGDLDIVVNNLRSPAQLFENQLCTGNHLIVELAQPETANPYALGAWVRLHTSTGIYTREVRAAAGYLAGEAVQIHFGFPDQSQLHALEIRWPDGEVSRMDLSTPPLLLKIIRS